MEKIKEDAKKYRISTRQEKDKYYGARISLNFGSDCCKRIHKSGKTVEDAVLRVLTEYLNYLDVSFNAGLITCKIDDVVSSNLYDSVREIGLSNPEVIQKTLEIVNKINYINSCILNKIYLPSNVLLFQAQQPVQQFTINNLENNNTISNANNNVQTTEIAKCLIKDIAFEWHRYRLLLCHKTPKNPKPLSQKTVDNHYELLTTNILPFLEKKKILYLSQITTKIIEDMLDSINAQCSKNKAYVVLNLIFKYAIKNNKAKDNPLEKVNKPPEKIDDGNEDDDDNYIEPDEQDKWLDLFESEKTDKSLAYELILLTRYETRRSVSD